MWRIWQQKLDQNGRSDHCDFKAWSDKMGMNGFTEDDGIYWTGLWTEKNKILLGSSSEEKTNGECEEENYDEEDQPYELHWTMEIQRSVKPMQNNIRIRETAIIQANMWINWWVIYNSWG